VIAAVPTMDWEHAIRLGLGRFAEGNGLIVVFLFVTVVVGATVTYAQAAGAPRNMKEFGHHILPPGTIGHPSTKTDCLFWLSKRLVMPSLVMLLGVTTYAAGHFFYSLLAWIFGPAAHPDGQSAFWVMCIFTANMMIVYDFCNYALHRLQHRVPVLWELHKTHHSAMRMVGITKDRVHPIDEILSRCWTGLISGPIYAVWLYFVLDPVELTILGINAYALINTVIMMDFVRHTHLKLSYGKVLNFVFLCPHYHQLHHSVDPRHYDQNFGQVLAIWDRMFGTLAVPGKGEDFTFGLADHEAEEYQSLVRIYAVPMIKASQVARRQMAGVKHRVFSRARSPGDAPGRAAPEGSRSGV
jgi:sterol desaturase/sphingolipid hydroxylase (fatty acid hydroxylase superfamily)